MYFTLSSSLTNLNVNGPIAEETSFEFFAKKTKLTVSGIKGFKIYISKRNVPSWLLVLNSTH